MREKFDLLRELGDGAFGEASNAREAWRSWALYFAVAAGAGVFMAFVGALGTEQQPLPARVAYWVISMVVGSALGQIARIFVQQVLVGERTRNLAVLIVPISVTVAIPIALFVLALNWLFAGEAPSLRRVVPLSITVFFVALTMSAVFMLLARARGRETKAGPAPPRFLERLPAKLRGAQVYAVESEDHYLRLHTSKGQDLILFRLSDAIAELDGIEGMQAHRSWWVARDGVADVKRADGKVSLVLKDGAEAPVSRGNVRMLREAGWL